MSSSPTNIKAFKKTRLLKRLSIMRTAREAGKKAGLLVLWGCWLRIYHENMSHRWKTIPSFDLEFLCPVWEEYQVFLTVSCFQMNSAVLLSGVTEHLQFFFFFFFFIFQFQFIHLSSAPHSSSLQCHKALFFFFVFPSAPVCVCSSVFVRRI